MKRTGYEWNHLKNATREIVRSSIAVRDDAKIDRRTAGVTGIRLPPSSGTEGVGMKSGCERDEVDEAIVRQGGWHRFQVAEGWSGLLVRHSD